MNDLKGLRRSKGFIPVAVAIALFLMGGLFFAASSGNATPSRAVRSTMGSQKPSAGGASLPSVTTKTGANGTTGGTPSSSGGKTNGGGGSGSGTRSGGGSTSGSGGKTNGGGSGSGGSSGSGGGTPSGSGGSGGGGTPPPTTTPPVTTPPTTTPPPPAGPYLLGGDGGILAEINIIRANAGLGLQPVTKWAPSSSLSFVVAQSCALQEASLGYAPGGCPGVQGIYSGTDGQNGAALILDYANSTGGGLVDLPYLNEVYIGWAYNPANNQTYVDVQFCSVAPNSGSVCQ